MSHSANKSGCSINFPASKKPKLDRSVGEPTADDELWGEDLLAEDLDECFLLASQMCTDTQPIKSHIQVQPAQNLPPHINSWSRQINTLPPPKLNSTITPLQGGQSMAQHQRLIIPEHLPNINVSEHRLSDKWEIPAGSSNQTSITNLPGNEEMLDPQRNAMEADIRKLSEENKKWKESLFTKDGEVSNLRRQLKQSEAKLNTQLEMKALDYEEKLRVMKKELEKAKTTLELQKLEAWKATDRLLLASQSIVEVVEQRTDVNDALVFKANVGESSGLILNDLLNPHLYGKSDLEIHQVKLESKFSLQVSTTNRKRVSWRPSLYPYRLSVESSWSLVNQLGLQDSFKTVKSTCYMDSIFVECRAVLYGLLLTLRERGKEETLELLDYRDRQLIETQVEALENPVLLSNKMWYDVERGLEARRALGLLSAICTLSKHMSNLVCGTTKGGVIVGEDEREELSSHLNNNFGIANFVFEENLPCETGNTELTSKTAMDVGVIRPASGHDNIEPSTLQNKNGSKNKKSEISEQNELRLKYESKENGFLHLLNDLANVIFNQRNSFEYSGFLTGVATLLSTSLCKTSLPASGNSVVGDIIRGIVFSRPRVETVVALSELLFALSSNIQVMDTLCHGLENKVYVDIACGLGFFKPNSCVIQILCWLLEFRNTNVSSRTRLCRSIVNWVWACIKRRPHRGPAWAQCSSDETSSSCFCRARLAEVTVKLIYQTYKDFELLALTEHGEGLRKALVRGIVLLHQLTETDTEFGTYMQEAEGCYQWLLIGLRNTPHDLCLDENEGEALRELLAMEDATEPHPFIETEKTGKHLQDVCTSLKSCWAVQSISHHVSTDIVEVE